MTDKDVFFADGNHPKMIEAFKNAQQTFKYYWRELSWEYRRIIPALHVACVKIAFTERVENSNDPIVEHMWINDVEFDGNMVKGILINNPNQLQNISNGDVINVPLNQISDWLFAMTDAQPKGLSKLFSSERKPKAYGGFTIQSIRSGMSKKERQAHDAAWGLDFGDVNDILLVYEQKKKPGNLIEHPMSINMKEKLKDFLKDNPNEINNSDANGLTLLHSETIAGNLSSVEVLLAFGADKNSISNHGETALDFAKKMNWEHIIPILEA